MSPDTPKVLTAASRDTAPDESLALRVAAILYSVIASIIVYNMDCGMHLAMAAMIFENWPEQHECR